MNYLLIPWGTFSLLLAGFVRDIKSNKPNKDVKVHASYLASFQCVVLVLLTNRDPSEKQQ